LLKNEGAEDRALQRGMLLLVLEAKGDLFKIAQHTPRQEI
jgi:hypothetical protein